MKRFAILAAIVALIGCTQNDENLDKITNTPQKSQTEFYASMPECDTRTYVEDNKYLRWNAGDEITVFAGNSYNSHWQFIGEDGANSGKFNEIEAGGFVTGTPLDLTANYAIYPYDENITITEAGVVSITLPAVQEYNHTYANSFGAGANTMMAVTKNTSDNFLAFKNLCGYLKLKFYGDDVTVKSITVKGNNGEKIAGSATVTMAYGGEPTIYMSDDATDTITIDCGEGVVLSADSETPTIFWVVIPEITFAGGITIEVTDINNQTFERKTTNAVPIENNLIQPMATLGVEFAPAEIPETWKIYYTATAKVSEKWWDKDAFGANVVSHEWNSDTGNGVIAFDGAVTSIGFNAFYDCDNLRSIAIPDSVISIGAVAFASCSSLTSITIPNSVTSIGESAFSWCVSLTNVTIPDSVISIGEGAFYNCSSLREFRGRFASNDGRCLIINGVLNSFATGHVATQYTIPNGVTEIGYAAFSRCKLTSITIPNSVTMIRDYAFYLCSSLTSIYCQPVRTPNCGNYLFDSDTSSCKMYVPTASVSSYMYESALGHYFNIVGYDF